MMIVEVNLKLLWKRARECLDPTHLFINILPIFLSLGYSNSVTWRLAKSQNHAYAWLQVVRVSQSCSGDGKRIEKNSQFIQYLYLRQLSESLAYQSEMSGKQ